MTWKAQRKALYAAGSGTLPPMHPSTRKSLLWGGYIDAHGITKMGVEARRLARAEDARVAAAWDGWEGWR
jgi:hypothetical protein